MPPADPRDLRPSGDGEAAKLVAEARVYAGRFTPGALLRAIDLHERAIARDPGLAAAWTGLAGTLMVAMLASVLLPARRATARAMAEQAIRIDTASGAPLAIRAVLDTGECRWEEAAAGFAAAAARSPDDPTVGEAAALHLWASIGHIGHAAALVRAATRHAPTSANVALSRAWVATLAGDHAATAAQLDRSLLRRRGGALRLRRRQRHRRRRGIGGGCDAHAHADAATPPTPTASYVGAVYAGANYVGNNSGFDIDGNYVVAFGRAADGRLAQLGYFETGGKGSGGVRDAKAPARLDPLIAEDSLLAVDDRFLLVVNAGSNPVTSFRINADFTLTRAGIADSGGTMPVSLAYRAGIVYVANADEDGVFDGPPNQSGNIVALRLDQATGQLTRIAGPARSLRGRPAELEVTADGAFLVASAANAASPVLPQPTAAEVATFRIAADGTLAAAPAGTGMSTSLNNSAGRNLPNAIAIETSAAGGRQFVIAAEARSVSAAGVPPAHFRRLADRIGLDLGDHGGRRAAATVPGHDARLVLHVGTGAGELPRLFARLFDLLARDHGGRHHLGVRPAAGRHGRRWRDVRARRRDRSGLRHAARRRRRLCRPRDQPRSPLALSAGRAEGPDRRL